MQTWIDNNPDKDGPQTEVLTGEPNEEKRKQQVEKGNEWQQAIDDFSPKVKNYF